MKSFKKAYLPDVSPKNIADQFNISLEEAAKQIRFLDSQDVYLNDVYQVNVDLSNKNFIWLSIKRIDKKPVTDWRHKQQIKKELAKGKPTYEVAFKLGFQACIESVRDKHYLFLVKKLEIEYSKL